MNSKCPCPPCTYSSDSIALLHVHCINAHPKEFFTCPWCTIPFATLRALQKHAPNCPALDKNEPREGEINDVLVNGEKCLVCEGRFPSNELSIKHYKEQHLNFSYICDVCEMYFQHSSSLDIHFAKSHPKRQTANETTQTQCNVQASVSKASSNPSASAQTQTEDASVNVMQKKKRTAQAAFNEPSSIGLAGPSNPTSNTSDENCVPAITGSSAKTYSPGAKRKLMKFAKKRYCLECKLSLRNLRDVEDHFAAAHGWKIFLCDGCNNAYVSQSNRSRHLSKCTGNNRDRNENAEATPKRRNLDEILASVIINQTLFGCHLCDFKTASHEAIKDHMDAHMQTPLSRIKTENADSATSSTNGRELKQEFIEHWSTFNNGERPPPTEGGFMDLTSDDD